MNKLLSVLVLTMALFTAFDAEALSSTGCYVPINNVGADEIIPSNGVTNYFPGTNGLICGVAASDAVDLIKSGYIQVTPNPLLVQNIPVASVNAAGGALIAAGATGHTIYPQNLSVMVSGTAASATSVKVVCEPSGALLATYAIAQLVNNVPVSPFSASVTAGPAITQGCAAGDSIYASTVGSALTTTTNIFVNLPYTVQ